MSLQGLHHHDAGGVLMLAGLDWLPDDGSAGRWFGGSHMAWRGARAVLRSASPRIGGTGALLAEMCLAAESDGHDTSGLRVWVARVHDGDDDLAGDRARWWLGGTQDGAPSQTVTEEVHATRADLVNALGQIAMTSDLAGIGVCETSADALLAATRAHGPELPEPVICGLEGHAAGGRSDGGGPRFTPPRRVRSAATALTAVMAAAVIGGAAWAVGLIGPSAEPRVSTVSLVAPQRAAGLIACMKGLDGAWPRAPGWRVSRSGCARPAWLSREVSVPDALSLDMVIWRTYDREAGANAVLAEAAAKRLIAGWTPDRVGQSGHLRPGASDERLILWRILHLPTESLDPSGADVTEMVRRLAETFADEPGAVSRDGADVTLQVSEPPASAFDRLGHNGMAGQGNQGDPLHRDAGRGVEPTTDNAPDIELLSVTWTGERTTMRLRARTGDVL